MQYTFTKHIEYMEFHDFVVIFGLTWVFVGLLVKVMLSNQHTKSNTDCDSNDADTDSNNADIDTDTDSYDSDSTLVNTGSRANSELDDTIHYNTDNTDNEN